MREAVGALVQLIHDPNGSSPRVLASHVDVADGVLSQARGLMFRRSIPDDYALAFPFDEVGTRSLHMLFVPFAIDALWVVDDEVVGTKRLSAWTGLGWNTADVVYELPAGAADGVDVGDTVVLDGDDGAV
ncbi:putative ACR [Halogranum salarium B-1]|uniref:Putative ACR n=1 Tax=Halogranum salarium B-1 TaxID=1210908 RepID=J3JH91_9EURY|nr:putative ACR [Halogranum salarium B-1]